MNAEEKRETGEFCLGRVDEAFAEIFLIFGGVPSPVASGVRRNGRPCCGKAVGRRDFFQNEGGGVESVISLDTGAEMPL